MKKKLIVFLISFVVLAGSMVGAFFLAKYLDTLDPYKRLSDADFLSSHSSWQAESSPSIIWSLKNDNSCTITTNAGLESFPCVWILEDNTLKIRTSWLTELEDAFTISINRKSPSFTVVNHSDESITTFVPTPSTPSESSTNSTPDPLSPTPLENSQ